MKLTCFLDFFRIGLSWKTALTPPLKKGYHLYRYKQRIIPKKNLSLLASGSSYILVAGKATQVGQN
ncbi:MAG: hypothetical protein M1445_11380 [Bacteroidetes bacterium]|nr:hypothetical protein [Bacteroidota bacterium]